MGTNFYMSTTNKEVRDKYFKWNYELTDTPQWGYEIHIAKTSAGWLPLFQAHNCIKSVSDIKTLYDTGEFIIYDEYDTVYDWEGFKKRVLEHYGGVAGAIPRTYVEQDSNGLFYDPNMPSHRPISHFDYADGKYAYMYFKDAEGYEFDYQEFS